VGGADAEDAEGEGKALGTGVYDPGFLIRISSLRLAARLVSDDGDYPRQWVNIAGLISC
jgi:hypothetical protein